MTTPHRTLLQQALDALEGTDLGLHYAAIAALREALAASPAAPASQWMPIETAPKYVTILLYGAKRLEMCVGMHHSRDGWVTDTTSEWMSMYPPTHWMPLPAAPDHLRDVAEKAAPAAPPAAPAPAAPVPDGWVMVPREPTPEMLAVVRNGPMHETWTEGYCAMIAAAPAAPAAPVVREPQPEPVQRLMRFAGKKRSEVSNPCLTAREAIVIADWMQAHGIGTTGGSHV